MKFLKSERLLKRHEFLALSQKGHTFYGHFLVVHYRKNSFSHLRLGITITKKFGKAPLRNRFKRLVREAFRQVPKPAVSLDIVVRPRSSFQRLAFSDICNDLTKFYATLGHSKKSE